LRREAPLAPRVRVASPVVREVIDYCYFTGRTEAAQTVDVKARVTGYLQSIDFQSGDAVKAGQPLFRIDPRPYQAQLTIATAQIALAEARLKLAEADSLRAKEMLRTPGVITQADLDKYEAALSQAQASVAAAKANADAAQLDVDFTTVAAPFDGIVGRNYPSLGALVRQDDTVLATLVSQDPIYAYFDVDELTMLRVGRLIREGKVEMRKNGATIPVEMSLADEGDAYPHRGECDFNNNRVSPTTGTLEVRGVFDNPRLSDDQQRMFLPGMFVRIRVPLGKPSAEMLVPEAAIGTDQGRKFVLVVNAENVVEQRIVEPGPRQPGGLQVVAPVGGDGEEAAELTTADRVIVGGLQLVRPGAEVRVKEPAASGG
jgi:multidrug efflux system membrane fusion protein